RERAVLAIDGEQHRLRPDQLGQGRAEHLAQDAVPSRRVRQHPYGDRLVGERGEAQVGHRPELRRGRGSDGRCERGHGVLLRRVLRGSLRTPAGLQWFRHTGRGTKGGAVECAECGQRLGPPPRTGRPRRYCSRACQGRAYRRRRDEGRLAEAVRTAATDPQARSTVEVAVALADAEGIGAVTLRVVARRAGTALAAVHHDFGCRDRLVAAMVQRVLAARAARAAPDDATSALTALAEDEWQAYVAHPWLVEVMASSRPPLVPAVLDGARASIEAFRRAGLDGETAFTRYLALSGYVQGMALVLAAEQR